VSVNPSSRGEKSIPAVCRLPFVWMNRCDWRDEKEIWRCDAYCSMDFIEFEMWHTCSEREERMACMVFILGFIFLCFLLLCPAKEIGEDIRCISEVLKVNTSLTELNLDSNEWTHSGEKVRSYELISSEQYWWRRRNVDRWSFKDEYNPEEAWVEMLQRKKNGWKTGIFQYV